MSAVYLAAVAAANLLAAAYGPGVTVPVALVLIGLDLVARDRLHDRWRGCGPWPMLALITAGCVLSWAVNAEAGRVAVASSVAFAAAAGADALAYHLLRGRPWLQRANASNLPAALADSLLFPTLAFGALLPWVVAGQLAAKLLGGLAWSWLLRPRPPPRMLLLVTSSGRSLRGDRRATSVGGPPLHGHQLRMPRTAAAWHGTSSRRSA